MMAIETIIGDIGRHLKIDPLDVRKRNLYGGSGRDETHYGMRVEDAPLDEIPGGPRDTDTLSQSAGKNH
jgi:xanthine dehydrogenase large subunit